MKPLIAGNWKMNLTAKEAVHLIDNLVVPEDVDVVVCPSYPYLALTVAAVLKKSIQVGGQDCHPADEGAYTGDVSAKMLQDIGCTYVILGHSERRLHHGETNSMIQSKVTAAMAKDLRVILCIGETDAQNQANQTLAVLAEQLTQSLPADVMADRLAVAYEPVWAIGTGRTATGEDISRAHGFIRKHLSSRVPASEKIPLLYGGSVNAKNAMSILSLAEVNGVLVGGASLKIDDFNQIIHAASSQ